MTTVVLRAIRTNSGDVLYAITYPGIFQPVGDSLGKAHDAFDAMKKRCDPSTKFVDASAVVSNDLLSKVESAHPNTEQFELISLQEDRVEFIWREIGPFHIIVTRNADGSITETCDSDEIQQFESLEAYVVAIRDLFAED